VVDAETPAQPGRVRSFRAYPVNADTHYM